MSEQVAVNPAAGASPEAGGEEEVSQAGGAGAAGESIANAADPDAAIAAEEAGEEKPKAKKKLKLGEKELEFDEDVAALIEERDQVYQKRTEHIRAANKRFEDAAAIAKKFEGIPDEVLGALRNLGSDPFALHRALGVDPDALVTQYAKQKLAEMEMSPEQRAFAERERALKQQADDIAKQRTQIEQENHQREMQRVQAEFAKNLPIVLEKHNLPDDEFTAREIGSLIAQQVRAGRQPDYEEAAEVQAERFEEQLSKHLDRLSRKPGELRRRFPEIAKRLREEDVASVTAPRAVRPGKPQNAPQTQPSRPPKTFAEEEREFKNRFYESLGRSQGFGR